MKRFLWNGIRKGVSYHRCRSLHSVNNCNRFRSFSRTVPGDQSATKPLESSFTFKNKDPDTFGTLSQDKDINTVLENMPEEEDDVVRYDLVDKTGHWKSRKIEYYIRLIKQFLKEKKIVDAIDVLERKMLKEDRVNPNYYVFNLLISACGQVGYTIKAFQLYNQMKKRAIPVTPATYTSLFNACANSPFPEHALEKANELRGIMMDKTYEPNMFNYHAMVKAYGRCGDLKTAFSLVDVMLSKGFTLNAETFCFLLQSCISDKEAGFGHALLVWRKMVNKRIAPSTYAYNLMLRCTKECNLGNNSLTEELRNDVAGINGPSEARQMIESPTPDGTVSSSEFKDEDVAVAEKEDRVVHTVDTGDFLMSSDVENKPNLLAKRPYLGSLISLGEIKSPGDRLLLLGGCIGFLQQMEADGVKPNIKTLTLMLDVIPDTISAEEVLLKQVKKYGVDIDVDFCNMLIRKRSFRGDYEQSRLVLGLMQSNYLNPDIITFGVLSIGCQNMQEAKSLMSDMNQFDYRMNIEILGAMLKGACFHTNFNYIIFLMKTCLFENIRPDKKFVQMLDRMKHEIKKREIQSKTDKRVREFINRPKYAEGSKMFLHYYKQWLEEVEVENEQHPWQQFKKKAENTDESEVADDSVDSVDSGNAKKLNNPNKRWRRTTRKKEATKEHKANQAADML